MPYRDLIILSILLVIIFGGIGWTKLALWDWRDSRQRD